MLGPVLEGDRIRLEDGHWHDAWLGEILRDEWEAIQEKNA
jgi:hypothetical protein